MQYWGKITDTFDTADSSLFDAALVISSQPAIEPPVLEFMETTYKHFKPLAFEPLVFLTP